MSNTPTPRSDSEARMVVADHPFPLGRIALEPYEAVSAETCRQIERELTAAESRVKEWPDDFGTGMQHAYEIAACQPTLPAALSAIAHEINTSAAHPREHECPTCGKMREPLSEAHRERDEAKRSAFDAAIAAKGDENG